jgi:phosphohistidine phosphatase
VSSPPRRLQLVRHAKSSWDDDAISDIDRPLSARGERAAGALARHLAATAERPALVLCSPARRTRQTLAAVVDALGVGVETRIESVLYGAGPEDVAALLRGLPPTITAAMVIGHNPTLQDLALWLDGDGDGEALARIRAKFPTGALATLAWTGGWDDLGAGCAGLTSLWTPR